MCYIISDHERVEKILKAIASKSRLKILECIREGISEPNEIATRLKLSSSTTNQHLKILMASKVIRKTLSQGGGTQLTINYEIEDKAKELLETVINASQNFLK